MPLPVGVFVPFLTTMPCAVCIIQVVSNRPEANFVSCMVKYLLQHPYVLRCVDPNEFQVPQLTGEEVLLRLLAERPAE